MGGEHCDLDLREARRGLVDIFLTIEQNQQLVDWVKARERNLVYIYITQGHGDHYFGVKQLVEAFPAAKPVSSAGAVERAKQEGDPKFLGSFWNSRFPGKSRSPRYFRNPLTTTLLPSRGTRYT